MTRLTNEIRNHITAKAIEKTDIGQRSKALSERRKAWAETVYLDSIGGTKGAKQIAKFLQREAMFVARIPDNLRNDTSLLRKRSRINLNLAGKRIWVDLPEYRVCPYEHTITALNPINDEFMAIEHEDELISSKRVEIRSSTKAILYSVKTVKQLLEVWPEAVELLPDIEAKPVSTALTLPVKSVNKLIGLPSLE